MCEREVILLRETVRESIIKDTCTLAQFVVLIGLGWWIDSNAMQWFGGILAFIWVMARSTTAYAKARCTIAEARDRLDKLEAGKAEPRGG